MTHGNRAGGLGVLVAGLVLLIVLGASGYWFREPLADSLVSAKNGLFGTLGLGIAPLGLLAACAAAVALWRPHWFRHVNLWAAGLLLVALTMGLMGLFEPYKRPLAVFTLDGEVTLGGRVGGSMAGNTPWRSVVQLTALAVGAAALASPSAARALVYGAGGLVAAAYMLIAVSVTRLYRTEDRPRPALRPRTARSPRTRTRRSDLLAQHSGVSPAAQAGPVSYSFLTDSQVHGAGTVESAGPMEGTAPVETEDDGDEPLYSPDDGVDDPEDGYRIEEPPARTEDIPIDVPSAPPAYAAEEPGGPVLGKFNRFWTSAPSGEPRNGRPGHGDTANEAGELESAPFTGTLAGEWARPDINLLETAPDTDVSQDEIDATAETIRRTLNEYGVEVAVGQTRTGPTVTMYGLIPGWVRRYKQVRETHEDGRPRLNEKGKPIIRRVETKTRVRVDNILSREKDLALALKTPSIRIETPAMGKSMVGIEVPNPEPSLVTLRSIMESKDFKKVLSKGLLPIALGKGSGGENIVIDLAKMPHLLIAGATGSGKSVCINAIVSCLIMEKTPAEMRLLLIDPKRVELTPYNGIPHLLTPVVVETNKVVGLLKGLIQEMMDRYRLMEQVGVRNIEAYNKRVPEKMPLLVVAVDELADLMMTAAFDVEQSLCRLAQLGRATGIHLIVATQRPSVDVVTGLIKANFPSRVSFGVTSQIDSRTILDTAGADRLLGRGDMLYLPLDASKPVRAQNVFISDREIEGLVSFWKTTPRAVVRHVTLRPTEDVQPEDEDAGQENDARDELLDKAIELGNSYSKLSTSMLQRKLRIGYPRAARLMDQLEEQGIVGPSDGSKSRDVIKQSRDAIMSSA